MVNFDIPKLPSVQVMGSFDGLIGSNRFEECSLIFKFIRSFGVLRSNMTSFGLRTSVFWTLRSGYRSY